MELGLEPKVKVGLASIALLSSYMVGNFQQKEKYQTLSIKTVEELQQNIATQQEQLEIQRGIINLMERLNQLYTLKLEDFREQRFNAVQTSQLSRDITLILTQLHDLYGELEEVSKGKNAPYTASSELHVLSALSASYQTELEKLEPQLEALQREQVEIMQQQEQFITQLANFSLGKTSPGRLSFFDHVEDRTTKIASRAAIFP